MVFSVFHEKPLPAKRAFKTGLATILVAALGTYGALAAACDTKAGRDGGQRKCAAGLVCTGPFEGAYGQGNCQKPAASCKSEPGCPCVNGKQVCH